MMDLNLSLYHEHLWNLSAIFDQMVWLKDKDLLPWPDFRRRDEQLDAHVSGLVQGGDLALDLCREKAVTGDVGECYGAVRVFIRKKAFPALKQAVLTMDLADAKRLDCVVRAFAHEHPDTDMENTVRDFLDMKGTFIRLSARIAGYHRLDMVRNLYKAFDDPDTVKESLIEILTALGQLKPHWGTGRIATLLSSHDKNLRNAALSALVRIPDPPDLGHCLKIVPAGQWPGRLAGLLGMPGLTHERSNDSEKSSEWIMAAGMTGCITHIPDLIDCLEIENLAGAAAGSLNLITGADLEEEVFVPGEMPMEMLTPDAATWTAQSVVQGKTVCRISRDPTRWSGWWDKEQDRFDPQIRYRLGKPISPQGLFLILASASQSADLRTMAADELTIRYGLDIPFDRWMSVKTQRSLIKTLHRHIQQSDDRFKDGTLYYHQRPVNGEDPFVHHPQ